MKKILTTMAIVAASVLFQGCAGSMTSTYVPVKQTDNKYFTASIKPVPDYLYKGFLLSIVNKSNSDIEIDWNKTAYIEEGRTNGGFMYEGIMYMQRNEPKAPDYVFAKSTFEKEIYPNTNVSFYKGWIHQPLSNGRTGLLLVAKVDGKDIKQKIFIDIVDKK